MTKRLILITLLTLCVFAVGVQASCDDVVCESDGGFCCGTTCCGGTCISGVCSVSIDDLGTDTPSLSGSFHTGDIAMCGDVIGDVTFYDDVVIYVTGEDCGLDEICLIEFESDGCLHVVSNNVEIDGNNNEADVRSDNIFTKGFIYTTSSISNLDVTDLDIDFDGHAAGSAAIWLDSVTGGTLDNLHIYGDYTSSNRYYGVYLEDSLNIEIIDSDIGSGVPILCKSSSGVSVSDSSLYGYTATSGISPYFASVYLEDCDDFTIEDSDIDWEHPSVGYCLEADSSQGLDFTRTTCTSDQIGVYMSGSGTGTFISPYISSEDISLYFAGYSSGNELKLVNGLGYLRSDTDSVKDLSSGQTMSAFYMSNSYAKVTWTDSTFLGDFKIDGDVEFGKTVSTSSNFLDFNESLYTKGGYTQIKTTPITISMYDVPTITYTTPVIFRDGIICNSTSTPECTSISGLDPPSSTVTWIVEHFSNYTIGDEGEGPEVPVTDNNISDVELVISFPQTSKAELGLSYCPEENQTFTIYLINSTTGANLSTNINTTIMVAVYSPLNDSGSIVDGPNYDLVWYCDLNSYTECNFTWEAPATGGGSDTIIAAMLAGDGYSYVSSQTAYSYLLFSPNCGWFNAIPRDSVTDEIIENVLMSLIDESNTSYYSIYSTTLGGYFSGLPITETNISLSKGGYTSIKYTIDAIEFGDDVNLSMVVDENYTSGGTDIYCPFCLGEAPPTTPSDATSGLVNIVTDGILPGMFNWLMLFIIAIICIMVVGKLLITGIT